MDGLAGVKVFNAVNVGNPVETFVDAVTLPGAVKLVLVSAAAALVKAAACEEFNPPPDEPDPDDPDPAELLIAATILESPAEISPPLIVTGGGFVWVTPLTVGTGEVTGDPDAPQLVE